jgi:hypothetical protein
MAPKPPHTRNRGGEAVAVLGHGVRDVGGPDMAPKPPTFVAPRRSRGAPLDWVDVLGAPILNASIDGSDVVYRQRMVLAG